MLATDTDPTRDGEPAIALDDGPRRPAGVERLCVATGEVRPVAGMIRFVLGPDGAVVPDLKRKLPGRGVWVTATREALTRAVARKAFARSFRREVKATAELVALTEKLLERAALDALAIAHKAGRVPTGFAKVVNALARDPVIGLLHAADAARDGVRKLGAAARQRATDIFIFDGFSSAQLDLALGRPNVVHAALVAGPESDSFTARLRRLGAFRAAETAVRRGKSSDRHSEERDLNG